MSAQNANGSQPAAGKHGINFTNAQEDAVGLSDAPHSCLKIGCTVWVRHQKRSRFHHQCHHGWRSGDEAKPAIFGQGRTAYAGFALHHIIRPLRIAAWCRLSAQIDGAPDRRRVFTSAVLWPIGHVGWGVNCILALRFGRHSLACSETRIDRRTFNALRHWPPQRCALDVASYRGKPSQGQSTRNPNRRDRCNGWRSEAGPCAARC